MSRRLSSNTKNLVQREVNLKLNTDREKKGKRKSEVFRCNGRSGQTALVFQKNDGMEEVTKQNSANGPVEESWRREMEEVGVNYFVLLHPQGDASINTNTCHSIQRASSLDGCISIIWFEHEHSVR